MESQQEGAPSKRLNVFRPRQRVLKRLGLIIGENEEEIRIPYNCQLKKYWNKIIIEPLN